ncbi:MAG TPA: macro domain-containing protein [Thermoanaerobaculia bacterium]|nr:macro domain-containing protein [Thermoanaerobaculia bacterium]
MRITLFLGDIAYAPAEALCTSTNPRLSLAMGTGASVRERAGYEVLRACEALRNGRELAAGTAHTTTAGALPNKMLIHCVASDATHRSSEEIVRRCVASALRCAEEGNCSSVAMPVFASGHAHVNFKRAVSAIAQALAEARTAVREVIVVVNDRDRIDDLRAAFGEKVPLIRSNVPEEETVGWF